MPQVAWRALREVVAGRSGAVAAEVAPQVIVGSECVGAWRKAMSGCQKADSANSEPLTLDGLVPKPLVPTRRQVAPLLLCSAGMS